MKLTLRSLEDKLVDVRCEGKITQADMKPGADLLEQVTGPGVYTRPVVLNLERTEFIDSSGIGWLMRCQKRFREQGGRLVLYSIPPQIRQVLDLMKLGLVLSLADDEAAAREVALEGKK